MLTKSSCTFITALWSFLSSLVLRGLLSLSVEQLQKVTSWIKLLALVLVNLREAYSCTQIHTTESGTIDITQVNSVSGRIFHLNTKKAQYFLYSIQLDLV